MGKKALMILAACIMALALGGLAACSGGNSAGQGSSESTSAGGGDAQATDAGAADAGAASTSFTTPGGYPDIVKYMAMDPDSAFEALDSQYAHEVDEEWRYYAPSQDVIDRVMAQRSTSSLKEGEWIISVRNYSSDTSDLINALEIFVYMPGDGKTRWETISNEFGLVDAHIETLHEDAEVPNGELLGYTHVETGQRMKVFEVYGEIEANDYNFDYAGICRDVDKTVTASINLYDDVVSIEFYSGYDNTKYDQE